MKKLKEILGTPYTAAHTLKWYEALIQQWPFVIAFIVFVILGSKGYFTIQI